MKASIHQHRHRYTLGFVVSVILTLAAYLLVQKHLASHHQWPTDVVLAPILVFIALAQLVAQLVLFLHISEEERPRWRLMVMIFAGLVVLILVIGSLWIMNNLNYHLMPGGGSDSAIMKDEGIKP
jgi:cytochrome o ubiquinol oxidase operon protein cyoD